MTPLPKTHVKKWKILIERLHLILFDWFRISDRSIQVEENPHKPLDFSKGWPRPLSWGKFYRTLSILVAPALYGWNSTHHFRQSRRVLCYFQFFSNLLWMTSKCLANHAASKNFGTFKSRPLNTRWPLYTMRLINGPTIKVFSLTIFHNCS